MKATLLTMGTVKRFMDRYPDAPGQTQHFAVDCSFNGLRTKWKQATRKYVETYIAVDPRFLIFGIEAEKSTNEGITETLTKFGTKD